MYRGTEPKDGEIIKTDDGQYIRYNAQPEHYELLEQISINHPPQLADIDCPSTDVDDATGFDMLKRERLWDMTTTLLMLDECTSHKKQLADPKIKNTAIYKKISLKMAEHGHNFTPDEINNRMKTLISKFKEIRDHNNRSGNSFKDREYHEVMENFMGQTPNITPIASCSSLGKNIINAINAKIPTVTGKNRKSYLTEGITSSPISSCLSHPNMLEVTIDDGSQTSSQSIGTETPKRAKRFRITPRGEMLKFLKEYKEDIGKKEEERMILMREQHQETKEMVSELISMLKESKRYDVE